MRSLTIAFLALAFVAGASSSFAEDEAALRLKVQSLEAENKSLKDQVGKLRTELAELKPQADPGRAEPFTAKTTLSSLLTVDAAFKGESRIVSVNGQPEDRVGEATLTINERKGNNFKGMFQASSPDRPEFQHEVSGVVAGDKISIKSLSAARPFTLNGRLRGGYLDLLFNGPITKAKLRLKVE